MDMTGDLGLAEQRLAEQQATLRLMYEQVPALIWVVDCDLIYLSTHGAALKNLGRTPNELVGQSVLATLDEQTLPVQALRAALGGRSGHYFYEFSGHAYDSRVEPLRDPEGTIIGAVTLSFDVTERTRAEAALRSSREELRRLSAQLNRTQEEERRRIARQVHDELGQRLTALRLELLLLRAGLPADVARETDPQVGGMLALIDDTIGTVRQVATAIRPAVLDDFGFQAAIQHELEALRGRTGIESTVSFQPEEYPLEANRATGLYRIAQEVLTNVVRHAGATRVDLRFTAGEGWISLEIEDNGRGISREEIEDTASIGLVGVRERAVAMGGDVVISGRPGAGTCVTVRVPEEHA
jgi:PAS domain S-box-containing protein